MITVSAAIVSSSAILGTRMSSQRRTMWNLFGGQKANNHVAPLGHPMCTAKIVSSLKASSSQAKDAILSQPKADEKHFVLIHTGCHGAWCWYKIVELIRSSGHNVTALDMGASGTNSKQALEITNFSDYLSPLMEFIASLPADQKVVLVGHSFAGLAISKVMETFPEKISVAVFIAALMPGPTFNASTVYTETCSAIIPELDNRVTYDNGPANPPTTLILGPKFMAANIYHLSPLEDLELANKLVRPLYLYRVEDIAKEIILSRKRYGSVRRVYVVAAESKALKKEFQEWMIEKNPPDEVEEISGSDHMPMISKPQQLFTTLLHIANSYISCISMEI